MDITIDRRISFMKITKRNGETVPFQKTKIVKAVFDAACSTERSHKDATSLSEDVAIKVSKECEILYESSSCKGFSIESIQDKVECYLFERDPEVAKKYIVYREQKSLIRSSNPNPSAISDYIFASKYSRNGENWNECVQRCSTMHIRKYPELDYEIRSTFEFVQEKKVLPSMRSLQFAGKAIETHHARLYNCSFSNIDRPIFWEHCFYLLLCGCGVGFSVQRRHVDRLPEVSSPNGDWDYIHHHIVGDTIQDWSRALGILINSYFKDEEYVEFSYHCIRPKGSPLETTGGKAPGHLPLKIMLEKVRSLLDGCSGRKMTPFDCHRLTCLIAESVLAGGIRRSSLLSLFDLDNDQMRLCKTGDWHTKNPELAMANNSAVCYRPEVTESDFKNLFSTMEEFGEPGFFFTEDLDVGTNPCGEIGLDPVFEDSTGFAFCNLTEINCSDIEDQEDFEVRCRVASFIGTLQAGYSDFTERLGETTSLIADRDRLLGVSLTGLCDLQVELDFAAGAEQVRKENIRVAKILGINPGARLTTVKPSGTASLVLGAIGSGIHSHHAKRYLRRVTANPIEEAFLQYHRSNPDSCELKPDGDYVINFPISTEGETRHSRSTEGFLEFIRKVYQSWVVPGYSSGRTSHNVSATVSVKLGEWDMVADWCWSHRSSISAMSFLSDIGDRVYPYSPRYEIISSSDQALWLDLCSKYKTVDYSLVERSDVGSACEGPRCEL